MTRVLVDVNVILDVLLDRVPHVVGSSAVWAAIEGGSTEGLLAAHAVTTIHYLVRRVQSPAKARQTVSALLGVFRIAAIDDGVIRDSLLLPCPDFEDSVTASAASHAGCEMVITRDPKGFRGSPVRVVSPEEAIQLLGSAGGSAIR